jgi:hypothetical protein
VIDFLSALTVTVPFVAVGVHVIVNVSPSASVSFAITSFVTAVLKAVVEVSGFAFGSVLFLSVVKESQFVDTVSFCNVFPFFTSANIRTAYPVPFNSPLKSQTGFVTIVPSGAFISKRRPVTPSASVILHVHFIVVSVNSANVILPITGA